MWLLSRQWTVGSGQWTKKVRAFFCLLSTVHCLLLSGCGFEPVYAKRSEVNQATALAGVRVEIAGVDPASLQLKYALEDQLNPAGPPARPVYILKASLAVAESAIGVARDGTVSRYNVNLDSPYELFRARDNAKMAVGSLRHISSYNNKVGAYYSTYVSKDDAAKRGVGELAELYFQRLSPLLTDPNPKPMKVDPVKDKAKKTP